jgi:methylmalonyl-CoA/ethylmalonyl-CoA epimerase
MRVLELLTVNVAVRSLEETIPRYERLGLTHLPPVEAPDPPQQIVDVSFPIPAGVAVSLIQPTSSDSPTARFLERRGEGLHSLCLRIDDLNAAMNELSAAGVEFAVPEPVVTAGAHVVGYEVERLLSNWTRPSTFNGVMLELFEFQGEVRRVA